MTAGGQIFMGCNKNMFQQNRSMKPIRILTDYVNVQRKIFITLKGTDSYVTIKHSQLCHQIKSHQQKL